MTSEQARACFDAALDGELGEEERCAFEAALAASEALREEYARHRAVLEAARALGGDPGAVDLLTGVQHKLRARSGGRFYRDRFSTRRERELSVLLLASLLVVLVVLGWLAYEAGLLPL